MPGQVDPRRLTAGLRAPGAAHEHADPGLWHFRNACLIEELLHAGPLSGRGPPVGEVVERRQRMGLAAAELRDEGQHRGGVLRVTGQASEDHTQVLAQGTREAGAAEEGAGKPVVFRSISRVSGHYLLQVNGELVGVERAPLANFLPGLSDLVPGLHDYLHYRDLMPCVRSSRKCLRLVSALPAR